MARETDVTIVIPCFNHGRYLTEAVDSALGQSGAAPEVVVVDDGSDDPATLTALERLPQAVRVLRQDNAGPAAARNAGAAAGSGDLLLFVDADDQLPDDAVASLGAVLDQDPSLGYAYGLLEHIGEWGGVVRFPDYDPFKLLYRNIVGHIGLVRRAAFEDFGGYDAQVDWMEDWDVLLRALERGWHGRRAPKVAYRYRRREAGRLAGDRGAYRREYRAMRARHVELYRRSAELAGQSDLGALGRLVYRSFWAWRPVPAALERGLYGLLFRRAARSTASSTNSSSRAASSG